MPESPEGRPRAPCCRAHHFCPLAVPRWLFLSTVILSYPWPSTDVRVYGIFRTVPSTLWWLSPGLLVQISSDTVWLALLTVWISSPEHVLSPSLISQIWEQAEPCVSNQRSEAVGRVFLLDNKWPTRQWSASLLHRRPLAVDGWIKKEMLHRYKSQQRVEDEKHCFLFVFRSCPSLWFLRHLAVLQRKKSCGVPVVEGTRIRSQCLQTEITGSKYSKCYTVAAWVSRLPRIWFIIWGAGKVGGLKPVVCL